MDIHIDIETIPGVTKPTLDEIEVPKSFKRPEEIVIPKTIKKQETIDAWYTDKKPILIEEAKAKIEAYKLEQQDILHRRQSLDPYVGRILCIGYALDNAPADAVLCRNEQETIETFERIVTAQDNDIVFVGHNIRMFDLKWLKLRALKYNCIALYHKLSFTAYDKEGIFDTMEAITGRTEFVKLETLCRYLGIEAKTGDLDGSKVYDYFKQGRIEEIVQYCKEDVEETRELYNKLVQ